MGKEATATHPSEEHLMQFQQNPGSLTAEDRNSIQQHLQTCPTCREEVSLLGSFDFSLIQKWIDEEKPAQVVVKKQPTISEALSTRIVHLLEAVRSLVLHPAFAYGIVLLLLLPRALSLTSDPAFDPAERSQRVNTEERRGISTKNSISTRTATPSHLSPYEAVSAFLDKYKAAYEAHDVNALDRLWKMGEEERAAVLQLFDEGRRLSLLFDIRNVRAGDTANEASVEFAQVTTVLSRDGRFYTKGPVSYIVELRRRNNSPDWEVRDLQRVPD
jgi:hypothetical protein